ncbi:MAG: hypothetical protein MJ250_07195 [Alphaproteobacteria bacterium]|nr:hypothetical protein [Alphaproteobacteria bacterium]
MAVKKKLNLKKEEDFDEYVRTTVNKLQLIKCSLEACLVVEQMNENMDKKFSNAGAADIIDKIHNFAKVEHPFGDRENVLNQISELMKSVQSFKSSVGDDS